jgi:uncharacterized protein (DUF169 family)
MDSLQLSVAPVAVCLVDEPPAGVASPQIPAPSGCTFWEWGAATPLVTSARDHSNCAVGMFTHHMTPSSSAQEKDLNDSLKIFGDLGYVRPEDIAAIPALKEEPRYVVYAPLASTPVAPSAVLIFANSRQGLLVTEAVQQVEPDAPPALGRPACAVIPQVINTGKPALSLGCCGARAYLDILHDDSALWALPGNRIGEYADRIKVMADANSILTRFHRLRRSDIQAGHSMSVEDSLAAMKK